MEIPPCVAPIPASPTNDIPSTKTLSPLVNGSLTNPPKGVLRKHVTTPEELVCTELIPTPFELLVGIIWWITESNPLIGAKRFTSEIFWFGTIASKDETSTTVFDMGLKTTKSGGLV